MEPRALSYRKVTHGQTSQVPHTDLLALARAGRDWAASGAGRSVRLAAGLSQRDIARALGVTQGTVLRWERGEAHPRLEVAARYALLLQELSKPVYHLSGQYGTVPDFEDDVV